MRFIMLALALIGVAIFISDPQAFGMKKKFQLSGNGRVVSRQADRASLDFSKIGEFGAGLYENFTDSSDDSTSTQAAELASANTATPPESINSQALSAIGAPNLPTYEDQLAAIALAMQNAPEETKTQMRSATQACLATQAPAPLVNYFTGLVQVVAATSQLAQAQQVENFKAQSAPLTQALRAWLQFMPDDQRAANTLVLQDWAARPKDLVACHQAWLSAE